MQELTSLFLEATERFLDFRSAEVGSAVFDKVRPTLSSMPSHFQALELLCRQTNLKSCVCRVCYVCA